MSIVVNEKPMKPSAVGRHYAFQSGDRVRIKTVSASNVPMIPLMGRVVELRGPLGPKGIQIYRVKLRSKPKPVFVEVREDQLEAADSAK